jgi:lysophospholipase L1-like esterase
MSDKFTAVEQSAINKAFEEKHLNDFLVKTNKYRALNKFAKPNQIVFAGDSITEGYPIQELIDNDIAIYNRGISAIRSDYLLKNIDTLIIDLNPDKVFILIGTNDLAYGKSPERIFSNIKEICLKTEERIPEVKIYILSIYPVNEGKRYKMAVGLRTNREIIEINNKLRDFSKTAQNREYLNLYDSLTLKNQLNPKYSYDGLHLTVAGYLKVTKTLKPYLK